MLHRFSPAPIAAILLLAGLATHTLAAPEKGSEKLRFDVSVTAADPFHPANEKKADPGPLKVSRGDKVRIQITGTPQEGYHTYPVILPQGRAQDEISPLTFGSVKGAAPVGGVDQSPPVEAQRQAKDGQRSVLHLPKP